VLVRTLVVRRTAAAAIPIALIGVTLCARAAPSGPPRAAFLPVRLYPLPYQAVQQCRLSREIGVCPRRLPRAWLATWPAPSRAAPPLLTALRYPAARNGNAILEGISFGYSAPWEPGSGPGWRSHLWANRPCCFLHFELFHSLEGRPPIPGTARAARLGGHSGLFAPAGGAGLNCPGNTGAFFCNHARFFWRARNGWYVATLHDFGARGTRELLDRIVRELRPPSSLRAVPPHVFGSVRVGGFPNAVAAGTSFVWVMGSDRRGGYLTRIATVSSAVTARLRLPVGSERACGLALKRGSLYAAARGSVIRVDSRTGRLRGRLRVGLPGCIAADAHAVWVTSPERGAVYRITPDGRTRHAASLRRPIGIAEGLGSIWVAGMGGELVRIDATGRVVDRRRVPGHPEYVAVAGGAVWLSGYDGRVRRIDPGGRRVRAIRISGGGRTTVSAGLGFVWATTITGPGARGRLVAIDPATGKPGRALAVGVSPLGMSAGTDALWVANYNSGSVSRITR
jgi:hypothetical protein